MIASTASGAKSLPSTRISTTVAGLIEKPANAKCVLVDLEERSAAQHWDARGAMGQSAVLTRTLLHHQDCLQMIVPKTTKGFRYFQFQVSHSQGPLVACAIVTVTYQHEADERHNTYSMRSVNTFSCYAGHETGSKVFGIATSPIMGTIYQAQRCIQLTNRRSSLT